VHRKRFNIQRTRCILYSLRQDLHFPEYLQSIVSSKTQALFRRRRNVQQKWSGILSSRGELNPLPTWFRDIPFFLNKTATTGEKAFISLCFYSFTRALLTFGHCLYIQPDEFAGRFQVLSANSRFTALEPKKRKIYCSISDYISESPRITWFYLLDRMI